MLAVNEHACSLSSPLESCRVMPGCVLSAAPATNVTIGWKHETDALMLRVAKMDQGRQKCCPHELHDWTYVCSG